MSGFSAAHNYFGFYENAMTVCLQIGNWDEVDRYAKALEDYSRSEQLPRCEFNVARGRALAAHGRGNRDPATMSELQRLRAQAQQIGIKFCLDLLDTALASP